MVSYLVGDRLGGLELGNSVSDGYQSILGLVETHHLLSLAKALVTPLDCQPFIMGNILKLGVQLVSSIRVQHRDGNLRQWLTLGLAVIEDGGQAEEGDLAHFLLTRFQVLL